MRREIITWSVVVAVILAAFGGTVLILNATLYSAAGFVGSYLEAIARHDADGALGLVGSDAAGDASDELLTADALGELEGIHLISDSTEGNGIHHVVYGFTAGGKSGESTFEVKREGTLLGLFSTWAFDINPLGVLQVSPLHGSEFSVNGVDVIAPAQDRPSPYLVFAPGSYVFSYDSRYLSARPVKVTASQPGASVIAAVDIQPTDEFIEQVQKELDDYLDTCATQQVLLPTGCPFGEQVGNRIVSTPKWSMSSYPKVTLVPGPTAGSWLMPQTGAAAHLVVDIQSLFDGSISTFDEDVTFISSYVVTFLTGDELLITSQ